MDSKEANEVKERALEADLNVVCVARLFLRGFAAQWQLQEAVDRQEVAYDLWDKELDRQKTQSR